MNTTVVDCETGEVVVRPMNATELAQRSADDLEQVKIEQLKAERVAVRDAAIAHAKTLGFTDEMIAVMYPELVA